MADHGGSPCASFCSGSGPEGTTTWVMAICVPRALYRRGPPAQRGRPIDGTEGIARFCVASEPRRQSAPHRS